jgi:Ser/Thr protein kinase RdoA (MazF antagonist)
LTAAEIAANHEMDVARKLVGEPLLRISRVNGGRNSRVHRVETKDGVFALKQYPSRADDPRDRLGVETNALKWMAEHGLEAVPRVVAVDGEANCALLSWVDGSQVCSVGDSDIDQAIDFLGSLERLPETWRFPPSHLAAEACLSGAEIERQIRKRMGDLGKLEDEPALRDFLTKEFAVTLDDSIAKARKARSAAGLPFEAELTQAWRSLVPSDFGFHNALRDEGGRLTFIDFEYFGWDDPVKLTADVLLHPAIPVASELRSRFRSAAEKLYGDDPDFSARLAAFQPLFALRWSLILLNEFHPERWRRRMHAGASDGWAEAKNRQLSAARAMLTNLSAYGRSE